MLGERELGLCRMAIDLAGADIQHSSLESGFLQGHKQIQISEEADAVCLVRVRKGFSYGGDRCQVYNDIRLDARNEMSYLISIPQVRLVSRRGDRKVLPHEALQMHSDKSGAANDQRFAHLGRVFVRSLLKGR